MRLSRSLGAVHWSLQPKQSGCQHESCDGPTASQMPASGGSAGALTQTPLVDNSPAPAVQSRCLRTARGESLLPTCLTYTWVALESRSAAPASTASSAIWFLQDNVQIAGEGCRKQLHLLGKLDYWPTRTAFWALLAPSLSTECFCYKQGGRSTLSTCLGSTAHKQQLASPVALCFHLEQAGDR